MKLLLSVGLAVSASAQLCPQGQGFFPNPVSDDGDLVVNHDGSYILIAFASDPVFAAEINENNQYPLGCASAPGSVPVFGGFETGAEGNLEMCCYPNPEAICLDGSFPTGEHYCAVGCGNDEFCLTTGTGFVSQIGCCSTTVIVEPETVVDGVAFTSEQSERALQLVNTLCFSELDAFLNANAASNLVSARPLVNLGAVGAVSGVGPTAMSSIKAQASLMVEASGQFFTSQSAAAVLNLVNTATIAELDVYIRSDAAANLVANRPYFSLAEVDSVPQIGSAALDALRFAASPCNGGVIVEGVAFTDTEASAVVDLVNSASYDYLASFLSTLAANSLSGATTAYTSVAEIAARKYVGPATLEQLLAQIA